MTALLGRLLYESASRLLEDFWREVERIMGEK
jgi:hypothetical protein